MTIGIARNSLEDFNAGAKYTMLESMVYFDAYRPVLQTLQQFGEEGNLPFADILQGKTRKTDLPAYLFEDAVTPGASKSSYMSQRPPPSASASASVPMDKKGWDLSVVFPEMKLPGYSAIWDPRTAARFPHLPANPELDDSQKEAIKLALSNEIAIIQGPPGEAHRPRPIKIYSIHYVASS